MVMTKSEKNRTKKVSLRRLRSNHYWEYLHIRNGIAAQQTMPGDLNRKQVTQMALFMLRSKYRQEWENLRQAAINERIPQIAPY